MRAGSDEDARQRWAWFGARSGDDATEGRRVSILPCSVRSQRITYLDDGLPLAGVLAGAPVALVQRRVRNNVAHLLEERHRIVVATGKADGNGILISVVTEVGDDTPFPSTI